jgi:hypothetical protein
MTHVRRMDTVKLSRLEQFRPSIPSPYRFGFDLFLRERSLFLRPFRLTGAFWQDCAFCKRFLKADSVAIRVSYSPFSKCCFISSRIRLIAVTRKGSCRSSADEPIEPGTRYSCLVGFLLIFFESPIRLPLRLTVLRRHFFLRRLQMDAKRPATALRAVAIALQGGRYYRGYCRETMH